MEGSPRIRIGTRGSDLALWQAHFVAERLTAAAGATVEIIVLKTRGDIIDDKPLATVEGKSFFTAEIERALLDGEVDVAVHSHKDLAVENPEGLLVAAVPARGRAEEWLLIAPGAFDPDAEPLPLTRGAALGTSSPRRQAQSRLLRPDLELRDLRGNVPTRVRRLREGRYDAIVLAGAGLERLELDLGGLEVRRLPVELLVPAPAQGALAIQVRADDHAVARLVREHLHDEETRRLIEAERALLVAAGGGCSLPLGAHVTALLAGGGYRAMAFLGADHPRPGFPARWARDEAATPREAVGKVLAVLECGRATGAGPLGGLKIALTGSARGETQIGARLEALGAHVVHETVIAFEDLPAPDLPERLARLRPGDVLALTSRRTAQRLADQSVPDGVLIAAVGPASAREARETLGRVDLVGPGGAEELAAAILDRVGGREPPRVLFPCAEDHRPELPDALTRAGLAVEPLPLYRTLPRDEIALDPAVDVRIYLSASSAEAASGAETAPAGATAPLRLTMGGPALDILRARGLEAARPSGSGPEAVILTLLQHFAGPLAMKRESPR